MTRLAALAISALFLVATPALAQADRATLEHDVRVLADDDMEGREAGTPGYQRAVDYVSGRFAGLGLAPGGDDGSWVQEFSLVRHSPARGTRLSIVDAQGNSTKANFGGDFVGGGISSAGRGLAEAEIVFVGYGLDMPELGYDDLSGVDLQGKIALWVYGVPEGLDPLLASHLTQSGADRFAAHGAIGSIMLWTPQVTEMVPWLQGRGFFADNNGTTWVAPDGTPFDRAQGMQFQLVASPDLSRELLAGQPFDLDDVAAAEANAMAPIPGFATGLRARVDYAVEVEPLLETGNVIGILPGTDPEVADQYVVVTAHLDHVGISNLPRPDGDRVFNGAMDNASGVAALLEMARLLAADPPRRPVMFVALGAEEMGLLGSSYHAANPGLTNGALAVNVNVDMPILTWPFDDIVAFGADRSNILREVAAAAIEDNLKLVPDPNPDEGFFFRSDQYSYVQQGIPAVYVDVGFGNGGDVAQNLFLDSHYHQPSDEADGIVYEQLGRFADVGYRVARNIANMAARPAWNAGDPFGTTFGGPIADAE